MAVEDEIQEIKNEIIQSHNLVIKTDNLIKGLSTEIRQIQKKQESYERKYWINSVWSYVIFAALAFAGVYLAFEAKVGAVNREKIDLEKQLAKAKGEADELQAKLSVRSQQEKTVEDLLRLKRDNQDDEALKVVEALDPNHLSPVLGRLVARETTELREKVARQALATGNELLQRGQLKHALREYDRGLAAKPEVGALMAELLGQRAQLQLKLGKGAQAAEDFLAAYEADPKAEVADDRLFLAAGALESAGDVPRAMESYRRLLAEQPQSGYAAAVRRRLQALERTPGQPAPAREPRPAPAVNPAEPETPKPGAAGPAAPAPGPVEPAPAPASADAGTG
jgi:tetratricopeptide (TPR) repeat protein